MDLRVIGVLLLIPLLDVMLLVILATPIGPVTIGPAATVAVVVLTALIGLLLVRAEGRHTMSRIQRKLGAGEVPTDELIDGALLLVAGTLLLTPGIVTDLVGLVLVLPPTRYPIRVATRRYVVGPYIDAKTGGFASGNVYLGGFPDQDDVDGDGGPAGFPGGFGASGGPGGGDPSETGRAGERRVDVSEDDYEFTDVDEDSATDGEHDSNPENGGGRRDG